MKYSTERARRGGSFRRLPVIFLCDTSEAAAGTLQVAMQEGLASIKQSLRRQPIAASMVYVGEILVGSKVATASPRPLDDYWPVAWSAQGECALGPALAALADILTFDLISPRGDLWGDFPPLVFLLLLGRPTDAWDTALAGLDRAAKPSKAVIVAVAPSAEVGRELRPLTPHVLALRENETDTLEAASLTVFFEWIAQAIGLVCSASAQGRAVTLPAAPGGILVVA